MKQCLGIVIFAGMAVFSLSAQNQPALTRAAGRYYEVISDRPSADTELLVKELELRFDAYNRLFRFDPAAINLPLRVRLFEDKTAYDAYVSSRLGTNRDGAVYLHYPQPDRRELVVLNKSPEKDRMLPNQAFIQFLRAFIPYPPTWMREGFTVYFNTLTFNGETKELGYEENLAWLETVKGLGPVPLEPVLLSDRQGIPPNFQPLSWALVSFFLNSGKETYFRTLTDGFMLLSPAAAAAENAEAMLNRILLWTDMETLQRDYETYLASRKTFAELIETGQRAYADKDPMTAEICFLQALDLRPAHYAPYYYLGLLAYEEKSYDMAEQYYRSALQYGADHALVNYALGLNAASAGKKTEAISFLEQASSSAPERYKNRVQSLLGRLRQ
jgi:tetratricopeptide (TPR) repeat protein